MSLTLIAPPKATNAGLAIQAARWDYYKHVFVVLGYGPYFNAQSRLYFGHYADGQLEYIQTEHNALSRQQFGDTERRLTPVTLPDSSLDFYDV